MSNNTVLTQVTVVNKFIKEFYLEFMDIEKSCLQHFYYTKTVPEFRDDTAKAQLDTWEELPIGIYKEADRSKDMRSRELEEMLNQERIIFLQKEEIEKFKQTITDLESCVRELEVDQKKDNDTSLTNRKVKENSGQTKKNSSRRSRTAGSDEETESAILNVNNKRVASVQGAREDSV
ncbi:hypothetical protein RhiirA4_462238 [Rhizophagus irregularis]|uniref:Uncharacterized protein n=1 Tax=Rhizophagus irregularis TaxID=588596 RepID=A0A2I1GKJ4_9GLOM|nr:hypothetical protein RhiirA4_462238 [Rhizophagus irregularis]